LSDLLTLAGSLKQLDQARLAEVISSCVSETKNCQDLFDLSRLLLSRRELESRIRNLGTKDLQDLEHKKPTKNLAHALLASQANVFEQAGTLMSELSTPTHKHLSEPGDSLVIHETLLTITESLFACERHWLGLVRSGIKAQDAKELGLTVKMAANRVQKIFQLAMHAGLVRSHAERWVATDKGHDWLAADHPKRWELLAESIMDLPGIKLSDDDLIEQLQTAFPLRPIADVKLLAFGSLIGLIDQGIPTKLLFAAQTSISQAALLAAEMLPEPVSKLIVQSDLSITSPGPITPNLHRTLDVFTESEDLGLACRFRLSALSVSHALEVGMSVNQIREFLASHSNHELPQPVQYLLAQSESRFRELTVLGSALGTIIESDDEILLMQISNESSLVPLQLKATARNQLGSRFQSQLVYFNLRAAGYAAVMVDESGQVISPRERIDTEPELVDQAAANQQAESLLSGESQEPAQEDMSRQLQFALKNKLKVTLRVELPDGQLKEFEIEPLGIAGNRIRGRDLEKEAELTLPMARIKAVWLS
jgi:hypothetical protein